MITDNNGKCKKKEECAFIRDQQLNGIHNLKYSNHAVWLQQYTLYADYKNGMYASFVLANHILEVY